MSAAPTNPCATCGLCCRSYAVPVCGYDAWRIARAERLALDAFLLAYPQAQPGPEGFRLERDGQTYALALDKQGRLLPRSPCIFLVRLAGGHERCGIYAHRPVVCQVYPMHTVDGAVAQRADSLCPPGSWPPAAVARPAWRAAIYRQRFHFALYYEVVARWNARLADAPASLSLRLADYFDYLMNVYARLDRPLEELGDEGLAEVAAGWGRLPEADAAGRIEVAAGQLPWLDFLVRARGLIDAFFPEVAPQPLLPLGGAALTAR